MDSNELNEYDHELYELLRVKRMELARAEVLVGWVERVYYTDAVIRRRFVCCGRLMNINGVAKPNAFETSGFPNASHQHQNDQNKKKRWECSKIGTEHKIRNWFGKPEDQLSE